jgi:hypothetical protein
LQRGAEDEDAGQEQSNFCGRLHCL